MFFINEMTVLARNSIIYFKTTNISSYKLTKIETGHIYVNLHILHVIYLFIFRCEDFSTLKKDIDKWMNASLRAPCKRYVYSIQTYRPFS